MGFDYDFDCDVWVDVFDGYYGFDVVFDCVVVFGFEGA